MSSLFSIESAPLKRNHNKPRSYIGHVWPQNYHDNFSNNPMSLLKKSHSNFLNYYNNLNVVIRVTPAYEFILAYFS